MPVLVVGDAVHLQDVAFSVVGRGEGVVVQEEALVLTGVGGAVSEVEVALGEEALEIAGEGEVRRVVLAVADSEAHDSVKTLADVVDFSLVSDLSKFRKHGMPRTPDLIKPTVSDRQQKYKIHCVALQRALHLDSFALSLQFNTQDI